MKQLKKREVFEKMKTTLILFLLLMTGTSAWAQQPCSKESFTNVSDRIVSGGYKIIDHKTDASVPVQGALNYSFYVEQGNEYTFVISTREPLLKDEFLGVKVLDSAGQIVQKLVNDNYVEVHFSPAKNEYVSIDAWLRSNEKTRDRFCIYHLFAFRKMEGGE